MRRWGLEIYVWQLKYKELERQEGNERQCTQLLKCKIWLSNLEIIDQYIHLDEGDLNTLNSSINRQTKTCLTFTRANKFFIVVKMVFVELQVTSYKQQNIFHNIH